VKRGVRGLSRQSGSGGEPNARPLTWRPGFADVESGPLASDFVYAVVLHLPSGKFAEAGTIRRRRRLREGATLMHEGLRCRIDHIVADKEPPLVYLEPVEG
jgi:hypothetical protein